MGIPSRWSYSSISGWSTNCKRQWVAVRINGVPNPTSKEALRGLICHEALEMFLALPKSLRRRNHLDELVDQKLEEAKDAHPDLYNGGLVRAVRNRIDTAWALEDFQRVPGTHIEAKLEAVTPAGHPIIGYADRIDILGDKVYLSDYKSGNASDWVLPGVVKQLSVYAYMWQQMHGTDADNLAGRAIYLGNGSIKTVKITQDLIDETMQWADESIADCLATVDNESDWHDIEASPSPLCGWCPLQNTCSEAQKRN